MFEFKIPKWWSFAQRDRLRTLRHAGHWIGFWNSDEAGQPARYGMALQEAAGVGVIHRESGMLRSTCGRGQLHATRQPLHWPGSRVWVIALYTPIQADDLKAWSLKREIIGEIFPSDNVGDASARASIRPYADLCWADLRWANLSWMDLRGADLQDADLRHAEMAKINLDGANLRGADLQDAYLAESSLDGANLQCADLRYVNLVGASLKSANLRSANLQIANFVNSNLRGADLRGADLRGADLQDADLRGADLRGADLQDAYLAESSLK
jgi:hypothetical protein